ncbi:hypothetical protein JRQ81_000252 [Phrynocephalus forsythii]|uniref:Uncharacterized protein n=1 Tax=Phrynocephalus forsythii TaxID=171643 RepID=A0A9Q0Y5P4_9SAUR|nr:hypothetical protein JRQ81_000252 [Phrynocephalus forsythii]
MRRSLAASGHSVGEPVCPKNQATSSEGLVRCSLASLGHSLGKTIYPEDAAELLSTIVSQPGQAKQVWSSEEPPSMPGVCVCVWDTQWPLPSFRSPPEAVQDPSLGMSAETLLARLSSSFQDGPNEQAQCVFLTNILTACLTAIIRGEDELDLPQTKAQLVAEVVAVLEQVVAEPTPGNILPCALGAPHHLSKMKPRTPWELEDRFLSLAVHAVLFLEEPSYDYVGQSLYRSSQQTLEVLLLGLLDEDCSSDHLFAILDHLQTGLRSQEDQERLWASGKIAMLLRCATHLQKYNIMSDMLGRYVADPKRQVGLNNGAWCLSQQGSASGTWKASGLENQVWTGRWPPTGTSCRWPRNWMGSLQQSRDLPF